MPSIFPEQYANKADKSKWGRKVDPTEKDEHTMEVITGYILNRKLLYQEEEYRDYLLWDYFQEDFEDWTEEMFLKSDTDELRKFRDYLRINGVYVERNRKRIAENLVTVIAQKEYHKWSRDEIQRQLELSHIFNSRWNPNSTTQDIPTTTNISPQMQPDQLFIKSQPHLQHETPQYQQSHGTYQQAPENTYRQPSYTPAQEEDQEQQHEEYSNTSTKQLTDLMKVYNDDEKKFSGELYDILNNKLQIFFDCCTKVGVSKTQYKNAYSIMLKGRASKFYYHNLVNRNYSFDDMIGLTRNHFETEENRQFYLTEWKEMTLTKVTRENPEKSPLECFELVVDKLQKIQPGLNINYQTEINLRDQIINACRGVPECNLALYKPAKTFESVCAELRASIATAMRNREVQQFNAYFDENGEYELEYDQNWTDRTYGGRGRHRGRSQPKRNTRGFQPKYTGKYEGQGSTDRKRCYICGKPGCWSTKHPDEDRRRSFDRFRQYVQNNSDREPTRSLFQGFLTKTEGTEELSDSQKADFEQLLTELPELEIETEESNHFFAEYGKLDGIQAVSILNDRSTYHAFTIDDPFENTDKQDLSTVPNTDGDYSSFTSERYSNLEFQGIMPDSGASGISSAGEPQVIALQRIDPTIKLDKSTAGQHKIRFGKGTAESLGTINVPTPLGVIIFHVVPTNTPFLYCIQDMDRMGVKLDNLRNILIQGKNIIPVKRKWGHPWMLLHNPEQSITWCHLTESELRQLHRRFGHPSIQRLSKILQRAGHDVESRAIKHLTKHCHQCQMNGKSPGRFKFTLKDDYNFNYEVIIDILYLDGKPVLQVVDAATSFQAARFLRDMSAKDAWDTLQMCWIDTYQGPPDYIVHDAGKNFASAEFKRHARAMATQVKGVPVEAHNSIGKVERYHQPLRRAYEIIRDELGGTANPENVLQMAVKSVNDSAGPNGLVPTLLVFGAYPRMVEDSAPSPSIAKRAEAIKKAIKEVRRLHAERQVRDALAMRNGPSTESILSLPIQSDVRVWREKNGWTGPFKLLAMDGEICTIEMPHGPTNFRSTVVKPYYTPPPEDGVIEPLNENLPDEIGDIESSDEEPPEGEEPDVQPVKRGRGRPKGSRNKVYPIPNDVEPNTLPVKRGRGRPKGSRNKVHYNQDEDFDDQFMNAVYDGVKLSMAFMTGKEQTDQELALKLRMEGKITTPGAPYEASDRQEIENLISRGVFTFKLYNPTEYEGIRIFNSRLVREIKGKTSAIPYEKSRLVIQGYQDDGKEMILTQSPTIQRASQRVIVALAPSLIKDKGMDLWLRDISQAYTQSTTKLKRTIIARLPKEMESLYPKGTIMIVVKPLYGIAEAGTHWWATYSKHHLNKLLMTTSTYDPCFLITTTKERFGIVGMQTDDTIILASQQFSKLEENELKKAEFTAKPKEMLTTESPVIFNGCVLTKRDDTIVLSQKGQGKMIKQIDVEAPESTQRYIEQRARGAYLASICQPEAAFDLSSAAQHQDPIKEDFAALNKRLRWQLDNMDRGLRYIPLDLSKAKLFVFVDGSFANNKDFSSQIGFEIILANESTGIEEFTINGNLIHWSSTKSKRITRSVLASEIYGMVGGVDMALAINSTLKMITEQLDSPTIPTIVCTDSYSLYECLVKLGTTKEKRLMIDIMALRQSYERRELLEIRWINGQDNPADAMTKSNPNKALETFIDTNSLRVRVEGWVKR